WLTGLSGSGKSTIGKALEEKLYEDGYLTYFLDGDNLRLTLNKDLGFTDEDRIENIRRAKEICRILSDIGVIAICSFISPKIEMREELRKEFKEEFLEVYVKCDVETCSERDVKGLYKKVKEKKIENFTGVNSIYEIPLNPELEVDTSVYDLETSVGFIREYLRGNGYV
ncbi:MAG: adenylyl-sulfate kinase, partial [Clostridium sp.]